MPDGPATQKPVARPTATPTETIHVDDRVVHCDGGVGALGHPRVWLRIVETEIMCPYCSRLFVLNDVRGHDHGF